MKVTFVLFNINKSILCNNGYIYTLNRHLHKKKQLTGSNTSDYICLSSWNIELNKNITPCVKAIHNSFFCHFRLNSHENKQLVIMCGVQYKTRKTSFETPAKSTWATPLKISNQSSVYRMSSQHIMWLAGFLCYTFNKYP